MKEPRAIPDFAYHNNFLTFGLTLKYFLLLSDIILL
jgi:hypothetical protein